MLRDCFRCYWFIDNKNRFRIEHISYFMNGGAYPGTPNFPVVGIDLTQQVVTRNGKPWAYARNQYEFDKPEMAARYQFGWMDDVTELFDGYPIDIISKYVNPDNIEQIDVSQFTSDIDYILLNPGEISKDGFVLLAAKNPQLDNTQTATIGTPYYNQIDVNIPMGQKYMVYFDGDDIFDGSVCSLQENSDWLAELTYNQKRTLVADSDISFLRIYKSGSSLQNGTVAFHVVLIEEHELPYVNFNFDGTDHILQNAWVSFMFLQRYYMFDMPAWNVEINGVEQWVRGIKKLKTQTIKFPVLAEPNMFNLIKTWLGNGTIQKMSVNLLSRNANTTLKYDTE